MDTGCYLKAGTDVYLANGFKYDTPSQLLHKGRWTKVKNKNHFAARAGRKKRYSVVWNNIRPEYNQTYYNVPVLFPTE